MSHHSIRAHTLSLTHTQMRCPPALLAKRSQLEDVLVCVQVYYSKFAGQLQMSFPAATGGMRGGVLADEMGLGKTVEVRGHE